MARIGGAPLPTITDDSALGGAVIEKSLRFNDDDSSYLNRTPSSASNRKTFTFSCWAKRGNIGGSNKHIFAIQIDSSNQFVIRFVNTDKLQIYDYQSASHQLIFTTDVLYRDVSAWYHIVLAIDTTQSTNTDRFKLYVNGSQVTDFGTATYPSQNHDTLVNTTNAHDIGQKNSALYFDGYLAEFHFVDGYQYDPSYFGFTDPVTSIWMPKRYEGSYGNNGFRLDFSDNSSTAALGIDKSPNGNDFTTNNFSVSAGAGNDSVEDTPTNNFPTFNPLCENNDHTYSEGNLKVTYAANNQSGNVTTMSSPKTGKWYWEVRALDNYLFIGVTANTYLGTGNIITATNTGGSTVAYYSSGDKYVGGSSSTYNNQSYTNGDLIGVALDMDNGQVTFYKNNTSQGVIPLVSTEGHLAIGSVGTGQALSMSINFGQQAFSYTPPTGFKKLCSANLSPNVPSIVRPQRHFDTLLYTPSGGGTHYGGLEFTPDLVWFKSRTQLYNPYFLDVVRGTGQKALSPATDDQEGSDTTAITSFDRGGFTLPISGINDSGSGTNGVVAWCWKAGGAAVSNTDGDITSSVSVNEEAGFSIATYTGSTASGALTVGHGLGKKPAWVMIKRRDDTGEWIVGHQGLATNAFANNKFLKLDASNSTFTNSLVFGAEPTTTVTQIVTDGNAGAANLTSSGTYVMYSWAEIPGFSKFGSYKGNGSSTDGTFVHLGFRPAWVMIKCFSTSDHWNISDAKRGNFNEIDEALYANNNQVEGWNGSLDKMDFLSNGFKIRKNNSQTNASGATYIYMAFAEQPNTTPFGTFSEAR